MKYHCSYLHPCNHCGWHAHSLHRCFRNKPPTRTKIHPGWIASWQWASISKNMFTSHVRTCSKILSKLVVDFFPSSHFLPTRGEMVVIYKLQRHIKLAWATISHSRVVARDTKFQESLSHNLSFQIQSCSHRHGCPWECLWLVDNLKPCMRGWYYSSSNNF